MVKRSMQRINDLRDTLNELSRASHMEERFDKLVVAGIVYNFCSAFELSWKLIKDIIEEEHGIVDYITGSPKENLKKAFELKMVDDNGIWLEMLNFRNDLSHEYGRAITEENVSRILDFYLKFLTDFEKKMSDDYGL